MRKVSQSKYSLLRWRHVTLKYVYAVLIILHRQFQDVGNDEKQILESKNQAHTSLGTVFLIFKYSSFFP